VRVDLEQLEFDEDMCMLDGAPYSGFAYANYPDGTLERELSFEVGLKSGPCKTFFPNGQLSRQWIANRGAAHGEVREWYSSGQLKSVGNYEFGVELSYDEWDGSGMLIASRRIDKDSELMKYVESIRERERAST
jgi:antitoxin component YwqK of YwqJK toxin-antitoxin module